MGSTAASPAAAGISAAAAGTLSPAANTGVSAAGGGLSPATSNAIQAATNASKAATGAAANTTLPQKSGGDFSSLPIPLDGIYQGYGVLVAAHRSCSPHDSAYIKITAREAVFDGANTGVIGGSTRPGIQLRSLDLTEGPTRLIGTISSGTFIGSLSNSGCVYDYTLQKVSKLQPPEATNPVPLGGPAPGTEITQDAQALPRPAQRAPDDRLTAQVPSKRAQLQALAERQARRGDQLLREGKVAQARQLFQRAAFAGNARGAHGLGMTYDPSVLATLRGNQAEGDALAAKVWYRRAEMLGDSEAQGDLARLVNWQAN